MQFEPRAVWIDNDYLAVGTMCTCPIQSAYFTTSYQIAAGQTARYLQFIYDKNNDQWECNVAGDRTNLVVGL